MPAERMQSPALTIAEAHMWRAMLWLGGAGMLLVAAGWGLRVAAGFALGTALALLNYHWLHEAVVALMNAGEARVPRIIAAKFIVRYPLAIAALYAIYRLDVVPFGGVLAGLFVPVAGALVEAVIQLRVAWRESQLT